MNSFLFKSLLKRLNVSPAIVQPAFVRLGLTGGIIGILFGCSFISLEDHRTPLAGNVQEAVDKVRTDLEKELGIQVPSLNVLIQTPTQTYFTTSVAAGGQSITPSTFFRFASVTKNFTATAIMKMNQDRWLNYEDPITGLIPGTNEPYIPNTPDWDIPYKNQITIKQLLQHSAGVFDVDNDSVPGLNHESYVNYVLSRDSTHQFTFEEMLKPILNHKLNYFAPGTGYHYSNTGYGMLSRIIERVYSLRSGQAKTYADYLYNYVTGPTTRVPLPISFPYRSDDVQLPQPNVSSLIRLASGRVERFGSVNMSAHVGEGNGYTTMASLNAYGRSLMRGENILLPGTVERMQHNVSAANGSYGLGTSFRKNLGYGHNGAIAGYLTSMTYDPDTQVSVVAMLPLWDYTQGKDGRVSFEKCFTAMYDAAYAARSALGYPGKP
jgi:D-alanyl-D-alanine carboxypeptidase